MNSASLPPSLQKRLEWGADARTAPVTPGKRIQNVDRSKVDPKVIQAAEGMESVFLDYMLQAMRKTVPKNEMDLESPATEIYRSLLDSEVAQRTASAGGIGLADQIIAYLQAQGYTELSRPNSGQSGGTQNEGQPDRE